nr:MAG TPA: hypothetical protein [Caudoviricetes sp.]
MYLRALHTQKSIVASTPCVSTITSMHSNLPVS